MLRAVSRARVTRASDATGERRWRGSWQHPVCEASGPPQKLTSCVCAAQAVSCERHQSAAAAPSRGYGGSAPHRNCCTTLASKQHSKQNPCWKHFFAPAPAPAVLSSCPLLGLPTAVKGVLLMRPMRAQKSQQDNSVCIRSPGHLLAHQHQPAFFSLQLIDAEPGRRAGALARL